jgi:hypothetical protein
MIFTPAFEIGPLARDDRQVVHQAMAATKLSLIGIARPAFLRSATSCAHTRLEQWFDAGIDRLNRLPWEAA